MVAPTVVPRAEHPISRHDIDPDALKVLYRLRQFNHVAYLVGGSVRDLFLGRRPKDFDVGTSAHPYQVKRLFRNCWIIGRRFRLAHVRFGPKKVIEVATFRRHVEPGEEVVQDGVPAPVAPDLIHHDNTFGSPEEDAFRRDFTINALFYDIATFSIIDYVGGLSDLRDRIVRSIGDPEIRFREDPVRMMRAVALAARLDFTVDPAILDAIRRHRHEIARSAAPRLLEEYYKILRAGRSERTFRHLAELGLLEPISTELHEGASDALWRSLAQLDAYRQTFDSVPETLTNAILLGSLTVPLGFPLTPGRQSAPDAPALPNSHESGVAAQHGGHRGLPAVRLGLLPIARRDVERLLQVLGLQRRLRDLSANPRAQRALSHRPVFREALTWLEIYGGSPEIVEHWKGLLIGEGNEELEGIQQMPPPGDMPRRRRRRRRRRRFRPAPE